MNPNDFEGQPFSQQQALGDVQVQGDDNVFNVIQAEIVTLTQTKIIQISVNEIKTRELNTTSPYKGLKKFEPEDTDRFFGRDQFIGGLVNELEQTNFVLLLGASGSGKSSVVRAGLIPWLQKKWGKHFVSLMLMPDRDPFESLYSSLLSRGFNQSQAQLAKAGKPDTLSQVVRSLKPPEAVWLIFIDQFEELFTVSEAEKRDRFITSLVKLSKERTQDSHFKIVATMRSDFLDQLDPSPANLLARITEKHRPLITQMHPDELRLAIEQPAAHHGVVFETGLIEEIIKDVQGQAGCLPLLQYTLDLLWETEVQEGGILDRTLNIGSYRQIGGVRGALQKRVDQIYQGLPAAEQLAAQRIFLKLVEIGGDEAAGTEWKPVRRRAARSEFTDEMEQTVLKQLIDENLLVSDAIVQANGTAPVSAVEIAHEILLTSWSRLNDWIQKNRQSIALRNRLNHDVMLWQVKRADSDLWSGSKLAQVAELRCDPLFQQVLGGFSKSANQFIDASVGFRNRERRRTITRLSGFSTVALVLASFSLYQLQQVQRQSVEQIATTAEALLSTQPVSAEINAIAAAGLANTGFVRFPNYPMPNSVRSSLLNSILVNQERNRLQHETIVWAVAFSPDGKMIASGSDDGMHVWDAHTGQPMGQRLGGDDGAVNSIAFSPDGKMIASGSDDGRVHLWDAHTGQPMGQPLQGHKAGVNSVAFSPDGKVIASGSSDQTIRLWDAHQGQPIGQPLQGHKAGVNSVAFSPNGKMIASGSSDQTIRLWDAHRGQPIGQPFRGHKAEVLSVAFSSDNQRVVSGSSDKTVRLWDTHTGRSMGQPLRGHEAVVNSVVVSPDGKIIASGSDDNIIRFWDTHTGRSMGQPLRGHESAVKSLAFSPDSKTIASGSIDKTVRLWEVLSLGQRLGGYDGAVNSIAVSPNGKMIASGSDDGRVHLWNAHTGQPMGRPLQGHKAGVNSVAFSPDGKMIASGSSDQTIRLWDAYTGQPMGQPFRGHKAAVYSVAFSPDGKMIASGSSDQTIRLWDAHRGQPIGQPFRGHKAEVLSVAFSSNNQRVVSGSSDKTVRLWDTHTGRSMGQPLRGHEDVVTSVAFSPGGKVIASGSMDKTLRLWDADTGQPIGQPFRGHEAAVSSVAFSPDGKIIVSSGVDKTVHLWDVDTGRSIGQPLLGHEAPVVSVAFSPDGKMIVSGSPDQTIRLWSVSWAVSWEALLWESCRQLQNHPNLTQPTTDVGKKAQATCHYYL